MDPISVHAVVLAGGHGSRMPPLVSTNRPKAMLTVANRPMLFYSLYALYRARITTVTVVVDPKFFDVVSEYVETEFHQDPLIMALDKANNSNRPAVVVDHVDDKLNKKMNIRIHSRSDSAETADTLRELDIREHDVFILSSDTIIECALDIILQTHRRSHSACTVAVTQVLSEQHQQQQTSSKSTKSSGKSSSSSNATSKTSGGAGATGGKAYTPQLYALINDEQRLLAMLHPTDLQASAVYIRQTLIRRYDHLSFVSDVQDPHVYCFHSEALRHVLAHCPAISSVKYDLIPYVARRQHTLWRVGDRASWALPPTDDFIVSMHRLPLSTYSTRANTVASFRSANVDLAAGQLSSWLTVTDLSKSSQHHHQQPNKKEKKKQKPPIPFSPAGERVSVTPDCIVAPGCSAGDRTSVKKSVIGKNCVLGSNVKLNGCVLLSNVSVKDGANLTATVVCDHAVIGPFCVLKECRVAANTTVDDETEATETGFGGEEENTAIDLADGLGGDIEFF